jgi:hypothetical protein
MEDLVDMPLAQMFARRLAEGGTILNDVVLKDVLVSFGDPEETRRVIARWSKRARCLPARRCGRARPRCASRSSGYWTTEADVERSISAIVEAMRA